ncbi:MAG: ABC transporter ATP-binding protein [Candidatus Helarchaeota archaeon]|nr:ABC transporter ATP-binding protein [Candidatus Helarchaeota archaeon]
MAEKDTIIDIQNLDVVIDKKEILKDVSFDLQKGRILGIFGKSGAGKSTTLKVLTSQLKPNGGTVSIAGYDSIKDKSKLVSKIGYVPQFETENLYPEMSAIMNVFYFGRMFQLDDETIIKRAKTIFSILGLSEDTYARRNVKYLSGGEQKRVSITIGLINNPPILILDEPTTGLDAHLKFEVLNYLKELNQKLSLSLILVTHDLETASICDSIVIIHGGEVIDFGSIESLVSALPSNGNFLRVSIENLTEEILAKIGGMPGVIYFFRTGREEVEVFLEDLNSMGQLFIESLYNLGLNLKYINSERATFSHYFTIKLGVELNPEVAKVPRVCPTCGSALTQSTRDILRKGIPTVCITCNRRIEGIKLPDVIVPKFCPFCGVLLTEDVIYLLRTQKNAKCIICKEKIKLK